MKKAYKYGIELETIVSKDRYDLIREAVTSKGLPYDFDGDGSIMCHDYDMRGVEIKCSRPLGYTELERSIKSLSKILIENEVTVNTSTGFHVHMSNKRFFNSRNLKRLIYTWCAIEDVLMATQPRSRYNNQYCQRLLARFVKTYGSDELPKAKNEMISVLRDRRRYYTLNLNALSKHGTIEVRMHSGTIDSKKILAWVELLETIFTYSLTKYNHNEVSELFNSKISDEKITKVFALLGLSETLTRHLTARVNRFGFEYLARQQESAWETIKIMPEVKKLQKAYDKASNTLNDAQIRVQNASRYLDASL